MFVRRIDTPSKYASTELRPSASNVDFARNIRGAQSAFGYACPSSPNTGRRNASGSAWRSFSSAICRRYRRYPAKFSSPPSPESATVTCLRASWHTRYVGMAELSA
jgi:hypothetical protein